MEDLFLFEDKTCCGLFSTEPKIKTIARIWKSVVLSFLKQMKNIKTLLMSLSAIALLGGCAHPQLVDMGMTEESVVQYLGTPHAKTILADDSVRLTYSGQPYGQDVWWLFLDKAGKVIGREQGLQEKYFQMLTPGKSTEADVWAMWGPCSERYEFKLANEHAWMYRFRDDMNMDMAVWPQFDVNGILRSLEVTEDPWKTDVDDVRID